MGLKNKGQIMTRARIKLKLEEHDIGSLLAAVAAKQSTATFITGVDFLSRPWHNKKPKECVHSPDLPPYFSQKGFTRGPLLYPDLMQPYILHMESRALIKNQVLRTEH